jgi:hypothetical protein
MMMISSAPITSGIALRNAFKAFDNERKTASPQSEIGVVGIGRLLTGLVVFRDARLPGATGGPCAA